MRGRQSNHKHFRFQPGVSTPGSLTKVNPAYRRWAYRQAGTFSRLTLHFMNFLTQFFEGAGAVMKRRRLRMKVPGVMPEA
jgi:hypothetical protein